MYSVRFTNNWNRSELTKYNFIRCNLQFNNNGTFNTIRSNVDMSHSLIGGEVVISGTNNNNSTFTIVGFTGISGNHEFPFVMVTLDSITEETCYGAWMNLTDTSAFYPPVVAKNSKSVNDNIIVISDDVVNIEAEKYVGDDFFVSEPRDAKISFLLDSDGWLEDTFLEPNLSNEINNTIFYEEDGSIIEYDDSTNPYGVLVGADLNGKVVYSKETLVKQLSKYVMEIFNDGQKIYTGFIDKSKTRKDKKTITIEATDSVGIISELAEKLIVVVPGDDDAYRNVSSRQSFTNLLNTIHDCTKLNFNISNNEVSTYGLVGTHNINNPAFNIQTELDLSYVPYTYDTISVYQNETFFVDSMDGNYVAYKTYKWTRTYEQEQSTDHKIWVTIKYAYIDCVSGNVTYSQTASLIAAWTEPGVEPSSSYVNGLIDDAIIAFENSRNKSNTYIDNSTTPATVYYYDTISTYVYSLNSIAQEYYSLAIPIYSGSYPYNTMIKLILYVCQLALTSDNDGGLVLHRKDSFTTSSITTIDDMDVFPSGYSEGGVERTDYQSDALDMVWVDVDNDCVVYKNFINYLNNIYADMLINRFPLELNCKIKKYSLVDGSLNEMSLGSGKNIRGKDWVILQVKENKTKLFYTIKAYRLGTSLL